MVSASVGQWVFSLVLPDFLRLLVLDLAESLAPLLPPSLLLVTRHGRWVSILWLKFVLLASSSLVCDLLKPSLG